MGSLRDLKLFHRRSYHGSTLGAFAASGDPETQAAFGSMAKLMPKVKTPFSYRVPQNHDIDSLCEGMR